MRVSDRERTRLSYRELLQAVAELAGENKALGEKLQELVTANNYNNQRINRHTALFGFFEELIIDIGHVHSGVLGKTVEMDREEYERRLDRHIAQLRRGAEEARARWEAHQAAIAVGIEAWAALVTSLAPVIAVEQPADMVAAEQAEASCPPA